MDLSAACMLYKKLSLFFPIWDRISENKEILFFSLPTEYYSSLFIKILCIGPMCVESIWKYDIFKGLV